MGYPTSPGPEVPPPKPQKLRLPLVLGVVASVLTLLGVAGVATALWLRGAQSQERQAKDTTTSEEQQLPEAQRLPEGDAQHDPAIGTVGKPEAPVVLDMYEDYLCPACAAFEEEYGEQIGKAVDDGTLRVRFHMLNFLNRGSASGDYSSRAAGAALAVFQKAPEKFLAFHAKLFAQGVQPMEGGDSDLSNDQLAKVAEGVGAGAAAADIRAGRDVQTAVRAASAATSELKSAVGFVATPTVLKDGKPVDRAHDPQWLAHLLGS